MQIRDSIQRLGPWGSDRVFSEVLTDAQSDAGLSDWRARPILAGGGVVLMLEEALDSGRRVKGRKVYPVNADTTIGALLTAALASGAPLLSATVPAGHRVIVAMYTFHAVTTYVCPNDEHHRIYPEVGLFCPVDGAALVTE